MGTTRKRNDPNLWTTDKERQNGSNNEQLAHVWFQKILSEGSSSNLTIFNFVKLMRGEKDSKYHANDQTLNAGIVALKKKQKKKKKKKKKEKEEKKNCDIVIFRVSGPVLNF